MSKIFSGALLAKGEPDIHFLSLKLFLGLVVIYCTKKVFANKFQDRKYKFIGGVVGALLGGYVKKQLTGTLKC
jgi:hypothetical protein